MRRSLMPPPPGFVLWRGPSRLDGAPIAAVLTLRTENTKTGPMLQTWILRADMEPAGALKVGADESICGSCPLRGDGTGKGRWCYVNLAHGPNQVYRSLRAGLYPDFSPRTAKIYVAGRSVRLGAYGDPVAVPIGVWTGLIGYSGGHTGYTHQWRRPDSQDYAPFLMASVESFEDMAEAHSLGWRTYRVLRPGETPARREIICPASAEGGHRLTCDRCLACDGASRGPAQASVASVLHGSPVVQNIGRRALGSA